MAEQLWLPWDRSCQPGWGKHHSMLPTGILIPLRGNKTGESRAGCSAVGHLERLSIVSACPAAQLCCPRDQVTPSSSGLGGIFHPSISLLLLLAVGLGSEGAGE